MRKKILIYAYLEGNFGDDFMVWILCKRYPHVHFEILAHAEYREKYEDLDNLKVYTFGDRKVIFWNWILEKVKHGNEDFFRRMARKAYALVHVGGSIYSQHDNYQISYMTDTVLRNISRKMYVCGANFGPYRDESYYHDYYNLLKTYDGVCFRDTYSYGLFKELPNVQYAPDLVFNYQPTGRINRGEKKQVLLSVIQMKNRKGVFGLDQYAEAYQKFIVRIVEKYIELGYSIKFVSLCKRQGDDEAISEIVECLDEKQKKWVTRYTYENDLEEAAALFDESEIIVGTRFHSIILGWLKDKKVLPIVYDTKTLHTLEDNQCSVYVTMENIKEIEAEHFIGRVKKLPESMRKKLIKNANQQFTALDKIL